MAGRPILGIIIGRGASVVTGSSEPSLLRFGIFELDPKSGDLRKAGVDINLPPQPAKVLVLLAMRAANVPDLRPHHTKEWKPIFGLEYATSTPMHHMGAKFTRGQVFS